MRTKYRVKVRTDEQKRWGQRWGWSCEACGGWTFKVWESLPAAHRSATEHAVLCKELHWRNWQAACPSCCKSYGGVIAPACPACQGYGWVKGMA